MLKLGFNSTQSHASAVGAGDCEDNLIKVSQPSPITRSSSKPRRRQQPQQRQRSQTHTQSLSQSRPHPQPPSSVFLATPQTDEDVDDAESGQDDDDNAPDVEHTEYCMVSHDQQHKDTVHHKRQKPQMKNDSNAKSTKRARSRHASYTAKVVEEEEKKMTPYFEKQQWEMCLLHSLNALYQETRFSTKDLDDICSLLAPNKLINPHKSIFQTGNWDCNVLFMALQKEGVEVQWFDSRKASTELRLDDSFLCPKHKYSEFLGFIVNNTHKRMIVFNRRHWLTIKRINGVWYNLDSLLKAPIKYEGVEGARKLYQWLLDALKNNDAQLMICRVPLKKQ